MESGGWDICVVVNERKVVLGVVRSKALAADPDGKVEAVMNPGPATYRPNVPVGDLLKVMRDRDLHGNSLVTTPGGVLLGTVSRDQAERSVASKGDASASPKSA
jgi:Mg/Co/Ni transporter MgtE